jgi:hypothetical protein
MSDAPPPIPSVGGPPVLPPRPAPPDPASLPARPPRHQAEAWCRRSWFVVATLVLLPPLGLLAMWTRRPGWGRATNAVVTAMISALCAVGLAVAATTLPSRPRPVAAAPRAGAEAGVPHSPAASASAPATQPSPAPTPTPVTAPSPAPSPAVASAPSPPPPAPPTPSGPLCGAPPNPWGLTLCSGQMVGVVPPGFCSYFPCVASFSSSYGYIVECVGGSYSRQQGPGSCAEERPLYGPAAQDDS